jgi:hypothetical protein
MAKGSCLCGSVTFEVDPVGVALAVGCYCINCRKVSGSQFGVYLQVRPESFRFLSGEDNVASFESSPGNRRGFCKTCGCVAPIRTAYGVVRVPGGALDEDPGMVPEANLFAERKAAWCTTEHAAHNFADAGTPEFWQGALLRLSKRPT